MICSQSFQYKGGLVCCISEKLHVKTDVLEFQDVNLSTVLHIQEQEFNETVEGKGEILLENLPSFQSRKFLNILVPGLFSIKPELSK